MNAEYRKKIVNVLQEIQDELPTDQLIQDGVYVWPILKVDFFLRTLSENNQQPKTHYTQTEETNKSLNAFQKIKNKIKITYQYFYLTKFYLRNNEVLSTGDWDHRVNDSGRWINRYYVNYKKNRIHFELTSLKSNCIELKYNTFILEDLYYFHHHYFSGTIKSVELENDDLIKKTIDLLNQKTGLNYNYLDFCTKLNRILIWADLWEKILKGVKPKEIRMLCYYGTAMYGLCIAGNRKSIPVIDMQHGVFGNLNPDYRNFGRVPNNAYNSIPSYFSVWNLESKQHLEREKISKSENILLEGNPWISYKQQKHNHIRNYSGNNIVYTLQTTVEVPSFMFDVIRETSKNIKWILKTHPRMTQVEIDFVKNKLYDLIKDEKIEINSETTLFDLLQSTSVHVSGFSGSVIEASLLKVPTIINNPIGLETYKKNIEEQPNLYKYAETKEEFMNALSSFV
jgi:hypothetical protein